MYDGWLYDVCNKGSMSTAAVMDSHSRWYNDCGYLCDCMTMSHKGN